MRRSIPQTAVRLGLAFSAVLALFGAALYMTLQTLDRLSAVDAEVGARDEAKHRGHAAAALLREQYIHQAHTIINWDRSHLDHYREFAAQTRRAVAKLQALSRSDAQRLRTAEIARLAQQLDDDFWQKLVPAIDRDDRASVRALHEQTEALVSRAVRLNEAFNHELEDASDETRQRSAALRASTRRAEIAYFALAIVIAAAVGYLLVRSFLQRIARLQAGANELATGNLGARISIEGRDELADLAAAFNNMAAQLSQHQQERMRSQRLAAIGQMAAGIAHEINNPLGVILGYVKLLQRSATSDEQQEGLRIIEAETRQGQSIVRGLLDLARPICVEPAEVDLAALAQDAVERLKESGKLRGYEVVVSSRPTVLAWGDEARLRQVLMNLLTNAAEATAPQGRIKIEAVSEPDGARLTVHDSGAGIADAIRPRVFDPFFTTKPQGVGLGLAISQAIVDAHGGSLEVESAPQQGTRVTMRLRNSPSAQPGA